MLPVLTLALKPFSILDPSPTPISARAYFTLRILRIFAYLQLLPYCWYGNTKICSKICFQRLHLLINQKDIVCPIRIFISKFNKRLHTLLCRTWLWILVLHTLLFVCWLLLEIEIHFNELIYSVMLLFSLVFKKVQFSSKWISTVK